MTNPWAGNGSAKARTRNAASTAVADTARHVADLKPAAASRRPPSEMQMTDCTAQYCAANLTWLYNAGNFASDKPFPGVTQPCGD